MTFKVYEAIAAVQGELAKHGISKDRENAQHGYNFRGIDDVYTALSPLLATHKPRVTPRALPREVSESQPHDGRIHYNDAAPAGCDSVLAAECHRHDSDKACGGERGWE